MADHASNPNPLPALVPQPPTAAVPMIQPLIAVQSQLSKQNPTSEEACEEPKKLPTGPDVSQQEAPGDTLPALVNAYLRKESGKVEEILKKVDPGNQELLVMLLPTILRLADTSTGPLDTSELTRLSDQLQHAQLLLRSRSPLRLEKATLCRVVRGFGDVDPLDSRIVFTPGILAEVYFEVRNFTCAAQLGRDHQCVGWLTHLTTTLELRDAHQKLVWRQDYDRGSISQAARQDCFQHLRFLVPNAPPGTYSLHIKVLDKPTERSAKGVLELRIAAAPG